MNCFDWRESTGRCFCVGKSVHAKPVLLEGKSEPVTPVPERQLGPVKRFKGRRKGFCGVQAGSRDEWRAVAWPGEDCFRGDVG